MNLALSSLFAILIVTPALFARRIYFTGELSSKYTNNNITTEIISSVFVSFIFHCIWIDVVSWFGFIIDFSTIIKLLTGKIDKYTVDVISTSFSKILWYFITLTIISSSITFLIRNIIRKTKLDRKFSVFRYGNLWYYILSGEILDIKKYNKENFSNDDVTERIVDVLTIEGDKQFLYRGQITEFQLAENESLEYIVLKYPRKREIGTVKEVDKTIPSNYFVIPFREILNINVKFIKLEEVE